MTVFAALAERWRADAELLDRYGDGRMATVCRRHADDLEAACRDLEDETLTLAEASAASGYSTDRLRHMVSDGLLPNAGRRGAPRIRRGDLPRKHRASAPEAFDATALAAQLVHGRRPA